MLMKKLLQEDRRLVILRILHDMPSYSANESIIDHGLDAYGHKVSRDLVKAEMHWLEEQDLITQENVAGTLVAELTQRGLDVATGQTTYPGVKRPNPS